MFCIFVCFYFYIFLFLYVYIHVHVKVPYTCRSNVFKIKRKWSQRHQKCAQRRSLSQKHDVQTRLVPGHPDSLALLGPKCLFSEFMTNKAGFGSQIDVARHQKSVPKRVPKLARLCGPQQYIKYTKYTNYTKYTQYTKYEVWKFDI